MGNPNFFYNFLTRKLDIGPDAGQNITVTNGNTVNAIGGGSGTEGLYNAGFGLTLSGSTFRANVGAAGFGLQLDGGTVSYARYREIETISGSSVTMQAGHAYKIFATRAAVTLNVEPIPADSFGQEGHLEIFVASTGYVVTGANVVLSQPLEPDAVNNCTVRFHDGMAIISVEDHIAGYVVTVTSGTTAGTLPYALSSATQEYIAFDATTEGALIDMGGVATNGEKHIVGNGYTQTVISGGISCTSKTTFSNLGMNGVSILGGTATLGDVYIQNGATVAVSGGWLAVEKVSGDGGVIDLGGTYITMFTGEINISGVTVTGGLNTAYNGGAFKVDGGSLYLSSTTVTGNSTSNRGGMLFITGSSSYAALVDCICSGNSAAEARGAYITHGATVLYADSLVDRTTLDLSGKLVLSGSNGVGYIGPWDSTTSGRNGTVTLTSGAVLDLTGNTNATPIAPGGGITFASGGATVKYDSGGSGASSSYMMDNVTLPAGAKLTNTAVVNLGGTNITLPYKGVASATGAEFIGGSANRGGALNDNAGSFHLNGCIVMGNTAAQLGGGLYSNQGSCFLSNCLISGNTASQTATGKDIYLNGKAVVTLEGCTVGNLGGGGGDTSRATVHLAGTNTIDAITKYGSFISDITFSSGAVLDLTGNTNATPIVPGGGIVISSGGINIIDSAGTTHEFHRLAITGSTINNLGQILGATVSVPVSSGSLGPWIISTTLGSSTVSATDEAQEIVIDGGLVSIVEL